MEIKGILSIEDWKKESFSSTISRVEKYERKDN